MKIIFFVFFNAKISELDSNYSAFKNKKKVLVVLSLVGGTNAQVAISLASIHLL